MAPNNTVRYCTECGKDVGRDGHMAFCKQWDKEKVMKIASVVKEAAEEKLNDQWVGGSTNIRPTYYAKYKIDPWTFCIENGVDLPTGSVIKYVMRHRDKNGVEDINKAIKCLEMIREFYYE